MARTLTATQQTRTTNPVGRPMFLVELGFSTTLRLSSASGSVTWNSQSWTPSGIRVERITPFGEGGQTASISLPDPAAVYFAIVRSEGVDDNVLKIWQLYGDPGDTYAVADAVQLFSGFMASVPKMAERINIANKTHSSRTQKIPRHTIGQPTANHLPEPGATINFYGVEYTAERAP